jgi:hypothetical protein
LGDPTRFRLPSSGTIILDFIEYSPWVQNPSAIEPHTVVLARQRELAGATSTDTGRTSAVLRAGGALLPAVSQEVAALAALLKVAMRARFKREEEELADSESAQARRGTVTKGRKSKKGKARKSVRVAEVAQVSIASTSLQRIGQALTHDLCVVHELCAPRTLCSRMH